MATAPNVVPHKILTERDFWLLVRRALVMIIRAIEARYLQDCSPVAFEE